MCVSLSVFLLCKRAVGGNYSLCMNECNHFCVHVAAHPAVCMVVCACVCVGCGQRRSMVCKVDSLLVCLLWQLLKEAH